MNEIMIALGLILLTSFVKPSTPPSDLPPLDEDKIQVHWIKKDEPAPFDGVLLNDYTYERMRLVIIEERY